MMRLALRDDGIEEVEGKEGIEERHTSVLPSFPSLPFLPSNMAF
jgi:hypothetical protein